MRKIGTNSERMQNRNRSLILQILAKKKGCSRTDLANWTGLTQAAISKIVSEMIEAGMVSESLSSAGKQGHRTINLSLNSHLCKVLAVKIARSAFDVAVFWLAGEMVENSHTFVDMKNQSPRQVLELIKCEIRKYLEGYKDIKAIGVAVPGPYLRNEGRIAIMSEYSGWSEINLYKELTEEFDVPIIMEHDTTASVFAEWSFNDNYAYHQNGVLVSIDASEGFGAGVMNNDEVLLGVDGTATEIGHMSIDVNGPRCVCGNYGCLELYCSAIAFAKMVQNDLQEHPESTLNQESKITAEVVFEHMRSGDAFSIEEVKKVGRYFGYGLANVVYLYNPQEIVITDIMSGGGDILLNAATEVVQERTLPELHKNLIIRMSTLKYDHILMGAMALASDLLLENPGDLFALHKEQ